jgi:hypothetical protein
LIDCAGVKWLEWKNISSASIVYTDTEKINEREMVVCITSFDKFTWEERMVVDFSCLQISLGAKGDFFSIL